MPEALQNLMAMDISQPTPPAASGQGLDSRQNIGVEALGASPLSPPLPSYQQGGMIGAEGMPIPMGEAPSGVPDMPAPTGVGLSQQPMQGEPLPPEQLEANLNQFATQNPQQMAQIRDAIMQELQSGELTPQELNQVVQMATVAAQNPEMYPYVRNFAIQQGLATEQDIPAQYDQGLVFTLMLAGRAVQQQMGTAQEMAGATTGGMPTTQPGLAPAGMQPMGGEPVIPSMATGGPVGKMSDSKPVVIEAHTGEYVIPKNVVEMKGKEFFDSLVEKYKDKNE